MNALLFERPIWFATSPLMFEEEAQDREEFIYHRPVLVRETIELLAPRAGALVLDATCGGGGHSEAILKSYSEEELTRLFRDLGEEPAARRIASAIVKQRKTAPFRETLGLARAIEKIVGRHGRRHPATQVFQALRMEVNVELGALEQ